MNGDNDNRFPNLEAENYQHTFKSRYIMLLIIK